MPFVFSTATCPIDYVQYKEDSTGREGFATIVRRVRVEGGHGVANKHLFTPKGVVTTVKDEELEFLLANQAFQRHIKNGFMTYEKSKKSVDVEKRADDMAKADNSAPLTPQDFKEGKSSDENNRIYTGKPKKA